MNAKQFCAMTEEEQQRMSEEIERRLACPQCPQQPECCRKLQKCERLLKLIRRMADDAEMLQSVPLLVLLDDALGDGGD